jgi:signal transduction histidine kinase
MGPLSTIILIGLIASVIFGAIYLVFWFNQRTIRSYLFFSFSSLSVAVFAANEIRMMHADSITSFVTCRHLAHVASLAIIISVGLFIRSYLKAGRLWLFLPAVGLRVLSTAIDLISPFSINFSEITSIGQTTFLGETLTVVDGSPNPLMIIAQSGLLVYLLFCADAAVSVWRRGERRLAVTMGGGIVFFSSSTTLVSLLVNWGIYPFPLVISPFFIGIVALMGYEMTRHAVMANRLSTELAKERAEALERIRVMSLAAEAGNVGVWVRDAGSDRFLASERWCQIFGVEYREELSFELFKARIHHEDRPRVLDTLENAISSIGTYQCEYRILTPEGNLRWISSKGKVTSSEGQGAPVIYGASADVTNVKLAELAARDLSGRLIDAQEAERSRLARELHDDLSQSLALLSIQVDMLSIHRTGGEQLDEKLDTLSDRIRRISSDVRRISHTLHPELLNQLGLIASIKDFCTEIEKARGLKVEFNAPELLCELSDEVALCLFRVTQESLQNVAKHSGSSLAKVEIKHEGAEIQLIVSDPGRGFNPDSKAVQNSLGLVSMKERLRSVNGKLTIDSQPGQGTRIIVKTPISTAEG